MHLSFMGLLSDPFQGPYRAAIPPDRFPWTLIRGRNDDRLTCRRI
jgi:hypothetical protein